MVKSSKYNVLAGINGGYFYEVNKSSFLDLVCRGKFKSDALKEASVSDPNAGISDGLIMIDGVLKGSNCNKWGYSYPVLLDIHDNGSASISIQKRGEGAPATSKNVIAGGPNLVSFSADKGSYLDVPLLDDNINVLEHSANTAIGLANKGSLAYFVTFDGYDGCKQVRIREEVCLPSLSLWYMCIQVTILSITYLSHILYLLRLRLIIAVAQIVTKWRIS
jgi:hypothetical protein